MQNIKEVDTKFFLLTYVLIFLCFPIMAQNTRNKTFKGDGLISFRGYDAWVDNHFYIHINIKNNSAKAIYVYRDSIRYADVRKDPRHISMNLEKLKYAPEERLPRQLLDSSLKIFEDHAAYTKDSIIINLETDKIFCNLLNRFYTISKEELDPKIERNWTDGYTVFVHVSKEDINLEVVTDTPILKTHPLLIQMISATLGKCESCDAVKKISRYYMSLR